MALLRLFYNVSLLSYCYVLFFHIITPIYLMPREIGMALLRCDWGLPQYVALQRVTSACRPREGRRKVKSLQGDYSLNFQTGRADIRSNGARRTAANLQ